MAKKETEFCGCCKYWFVLKPDAGVRATKNSLGYCKRYAPRMLSGSGSHWSYQLHPHTKMLDWCGEFEGE